MQYRASTRHIEPQEGGRTGSHLRIHRRLVHRSHAWCGYLLCGANLGARSFREVDMDMIP